MLYHILWNYVKEYYPPTNPYEVKEFGFEFKKSLKLFYINISMRDLFKLLSFESFGILFNVMYNKHTFSKLSHPTNRHNLVANNLYNIQNFSIKQF